MNINEITLKNIQPSQFYISEEKVRAILTWFNADDLSNFEPIPIKKLNGQIIYTDGHTRAWVAYAAGLTKVPLVWDEDELDWEAYQICVDACKERGVYTVTDFKGRILSALDYKEKWDKWCDDMQYNLELKRKEIM